MLKTILIPLALWSFCNWIVHCSFLSDRSAIFYEYLFFAMWWTVRFKMFFEDIESIFDEKLLFLDGMVWTKRERKVFGIWVLSNNFQDLCIHFVWSQNNDHWIQINALFLCRNLLQINNVFGVYRNNVFTKNENNQQQLRIIEYLKVLDFVSRWVISALPQPSSHSPPRTCHYTSSERSKDELPPLVRTLCLLCAANPNWLSCQEVDCASHPGQGLVR